MKPGDLVQLREHHNDNDDIADRHGWLWVVELETGVGIIYVKSVATGYSTALFKERFKETTS